MAQQRQAIPRPKTARFRVALDDSTTVSSTRPKSMLNMTYNTGNTQPALKPSASATALAAKVQLAAAQRAALGEIHNVRKKHESKEVKFPIKESGIPKNASTSTTTTTAIGLKRRRSPSLAAATARPARVPNPPAAQHAKAAATTTTTKVTAEANSTEETKVPTARPQSNLGRVLQNLQRHQARTQPEVLDSSPAVEQKPTTVQPEDTEGEEVSDTSPPPPTSEDAGTKTDAEPEPESEPALSPKDGNWLFASPAKMLEYKTEIERVKSTFKETIEPEDMTMVSEYAEEIFQYMSRLEVDSMPSPNYMAGQQEITWDMRTTLVDWLLQVHLRYHMLPETLWIAINIIDRFLSKRVVSLVKLQLVGVTAMFIAAKYEEIAAPGVDEFVFMTESGYTKEEILKGEKIILQTLDFRVSSYCSPYSWVRRISKADDYDLQTRTLCKFLMEITLLDHRFLRAKPSLIAAIGMYSAKTMLGGKWNDAFVFYSDYVEEQLVTGHNFIVEQLVQPEFEQQYIYKKYTSKRFLKAAVFASDWAHHNVAQQAATEEPLTERRNSIARE